MTRLRGFLADHAGRDRAQFLDDLLADRQGRIERARRVGADIADLAGAAVRIVGRRQVEDVLRLVDRPIPT